MWSTAWKKEDQSTRPISLLDENRQETSSFDLKNSASLRNIEDFNIKSSDHLFSAQKFIGILRDLSVPGPLDFIDHLHRDNFIASGGQFEVYRGNIAGDVPWEISPVAVKRCRIELKALEVLDLSGAETRKQVHDMYLEVRALRNSNLHQHRNVAKLIGWAHENAINGMPLLVMERAIGNLAAVLPFLGSDEWTVKHRTCLDMSDSLGTIHEIDAIEDLAGVLPYLNSDEWTVKHHICLDMSAGLDALHKNGIIHADFKPQNVLIFQTLRQEVPFVAKLADFGFSTEEINYKSENRVQISGSTVAWEAPEITRHRMKRQPITTQEYCKADIYSLGLVVWSLICFGGKAPNPDNNVVDTIEATQGIPKSFSPLSCLALDRILARELSDRPDTVAELFRDESDARRAWERDCDAKSIPAESQTPHAPEQPRIAHRWELQSINPFLFLKTSLDAFLKLDDDALIDVQLFPIFLDRTCASIREDVSITSAHIRALFAVAEKGFPPAQGIINRVLQSYEIEWPAQYEKTKLQWLINGAAAGCLIAKADVLKIDEALAHEAEAIFRENCGYQQHYAPQDDKDYWSALVAHDPTKRRQETRASDVSKGPMPLVPLLPNTLEQYFEHENDFQKQKMLYMACLAGNPHIARQLCRLGVRATLTGEPNGATCLHWLFNFPPQYMKEMAALLIQNGANVNARLHMRNAGKQWVFPYAWPAGTPLHWAVAASNATAVTVLIDSNANCGIRDGVDPYRYDSNVRYLLLEGPAGSHSVAPTQPEGQGAMDLAVANQDWRMVEALGEAKSSKDDVARADEEGYCPFHRLEYNWIGHVWSGGRFWHGAFWGQSSERFTNIQRTVKALKAIGGDINRTTKASKQNPRQGDRPGILTPLMLAVRKADVTAVDALLSCEADPNIENNLGHNALCLLPEDGDPEVSSSKISPMVNALLRYGTKPNVPSPFDDYSPLASAINSGSLTAVASVLQAGADSTARCRGLGVLAYLIGKWNIETYIRPPERWCQRWEASDRKIARLISIHVLNKHEAQRSRVLESADDVGGTLLHYAARSGLFNVVLCLLDAKVDVKKVRRQPPQEDNGIHSISRFAGTGTALDLATSRRRFLQSKGRRNEGTWRTEDYQFVIKTFCKVEKLLTIEMVQSLVAVRGFTLT